jgi:hypothetical protein
MQTNPYGVWADISPYAAVTCQHFDVESGHCALGIEPIKKDQDRCGITITFCRSYQYNGKYQYGAERVFVHYQALEYLGEARWYNYECGFKYVEGST